MQPQQWLASIQQAQHPTMRKSAAVLHNETNARRVLGVLLYVALCRWHLHAYTQFQQRLQTPYSASAGSQPRSHLCKNIRPVLALVVVQPVSAVFLAILVNAAHTHCTSHGWR
jgi:hypothetical protein